MIARKIVSSVGKQLTRNLTRIVGRPKLPGSRGRGFPEFLKGPSQNFPCILRAEEYGVNESTPLEQCAKAVSDSYKELVYKHGAVLLQGFPLGDSASFNTFLSHLDGTKQIFYSQGGGVRHAVQEKVYAASDYTNEATIEPHSEMSATPTHPHIVTFACKQPGAGGESVLVDNFAWYEMIDRSVIEEFERKGGIMYHLYLMENEESFGGQKLNADVSWKYLFQLGAKEEVEKQLRADRREFIWHEDNSLQYWFTKSITINHHKSGKKAWFNQSTLHHPSWYMEMYPDTWGQCDIPYNRFPFHVYYANGSDIDPEVIQLIRNAAWTVAVGFQLQKNEVIMIDNERLSHARLDFTGNRQLFAAFLNDTDSPAV